MSEKQAMSGEQTKQDLRGRASISDDVSSKVTSISDDFAVDDFDNWTVEQFPVGMVGVAGNSVEYITGGWRSEKPLWDETKCKQCMLCWINCPDSSILVDAQKQTMIGIDYDHCKGCGVCFTECRFDALRMVPEHENHLEPEASAETEPEITEGD